MNMSKCILTEHFDHPKNLNFKVFLMSASGSSIYFGGSYITKSGTSMIISD